MLETILIILFVVCFAIISIWKLDWAITLCIAFTPTYLLRFWVDFLPMTILEAMIVVIVAVWAFRTVRTRMQTKACPARFPWKWLAVAFVAVGVLAMFVSPSLRAAAGLWKAYIVEPVLFFMVFVNVIRTREQVQQVLWGLGATAVVIGFIAMLQYLNIVSIPSGYGLETPRRATSVYPFPTAVGKYVGPIVALFLGILITRGVGKIKPLWEFIQRNVFGLGVVAFGGIGLLFSMSRGALIGVFAAAVMASFFSKRRWQILAMLACIIVVAFAIPQTRDNILGVFSATDVSTDVHLVMWKGAWRIIEDNPILGTGLASFPIVYDQYKEASHTEYFPNPDHLILSLWIEMGLAGLVVFVLIVVQFFRKAAALVKFERAHTVGLMAAIVAILAHGFFDTPYFKNDLAIEFWVLAGVLVVLDRLSARAAPAVDEKHTEQTTAAS
ncbi:MAG: O-antigen ligase family protein [Patescibacteria group bacterium]|nr:O-antigen ligase family protein [Patescibacteria group bacterium]MDD5715647.1 O-antigen ligase family protein [Patescibacteria group bacterium]